MKLKFKLPFFTSIILLFSIVTVSFLSIKQFRSEFEKNIETYRVDATEDILNHLKDIVNIAYSMIDHTYNISTPEAIQDRFGLALNDTSYATIRMITMNMMKITLGNLRVLRFGTDGYIWINEYEPPYTVVMHAIRPEFEGEAKVFYIEGTDKNVYEAFHDTIEVGNGAGRVSYEFYKPEIDSLIPKISWVRLYEPLNWVIGTGVYVDYIDKIVDAKKKELYDQIEKLVTIVTLIGLIFILASIVILTIFARTITNPLLEIQNQLYEMSKGKIVEKLDIHRRDEIGEMKNSLDALIDGIERYSIFAEKIGERDFKAEFEKLSNDDVLGNSLIGMRDSLDLAQKQEQERLFIERKNQWINEGINRIGDIITVSREIQELSENVTQKLVEFVDAAMGSLFILEFDENKEPYLNLSATVAYDRKKNVNKKIDIDEGQVGACFMEKLPINLTDIPEDYIQIRTGLGTANPKNVYITPLKFENNVYGVFEVASFSVLDKYSIQLIEEVVKLLAVSLSTKEKYSKKQ